MALSITPTLDGLRQELRSALLAGAPTVAIRERLAHAEREAAVRVGKEAARQADVDRAEVARIESAARAVAEESLAALRAEVAALDLPITPEVHMQDVPAIHKIAIAGAADAVARAAVEEQRARDALRAAEAPRLLAERRLREKDQERAAIGGRRAAGNPLSEDAGLLLAIDLDREGLTAALADANTAVLPLRERAMLASRATSDARQMLAAADSAAREAVLVQHADACQSALLGAVNKLATVRSGPRPVWGASTALRTALRDLAARRGEL